MRDKIGEAGLKKAPKFVLRRVLRLQQRRWRAACPSWPAQRWGRKEFILDEQNGAVIGVDNFAGFRQAVLHHVDNPEITKMHGKNARAHVDTAYNVVRQSKEFAAHIERFASML